MCVSVKCVRLCKRITFEVNSTGSNQRSSVIKGPVSAGELLRCLSICLAMVVEPKQEDLKTYWLDKDTEDLVYRTGDCCYT